MGDMGRYLDITEESRDMKGHMEKVCAVEGEFRVIRCTGW
jgi:hypothetical protein